MRTSAAALRLVLVSVLLVGLAAADPPWAAAAARPFLHPLFSDGVVLQRDKPIAVWGWTVPGTPVTVALTGAGAPPAPVTAPAAADGRWQVALGPLAAGGPYLLRATSGPRAAEAKEVLIGDVWLCSGQSNMAMLVSSAANAAEEKAQADWPRLRHFYLRRDLAGTPRETVDPLCRWAVANPENTPNFTAVGYFFGRQLHQDLQVPIGLVHSSWGGTTAQAWTSAEALTALPEHAEAVAGFQALVQQVAKQQVASGGKDYAALMTAWYLANDPGTAATPPWSADEVDTTAWTPARMPAMFGDDAAIPKTWDGTVWLRTQFTLPASAGGQPAVLALDRLDDYDTTWINGQQVGSEEIAYNRRSYQVPAKLLRAGSNTLAIRLTDLGGPGGLSAKPEALTLTPQGGAAVALAGEWRLRPGVELSKAPPLPVRFDRRPPAPTSLYNGMVAPLIPLSLRGVIWYQGESNHRSAYGYRRLLPALITDWRTRFGQGDLPFLIVSLANYNERPAQPAESTWAELREAQALTARTLPACGLTITIDLGEAQDIHPKNKQEVGRRLARAAQAIAHGQDLAWSGPWFKAMTVEGAAIRLRFDHLGGGLTSPGGEALTGFAIAGEDRTFVWAEARIDGDSVLVSAAAVARPVAVRYAWANNPACNLLNRAGLPAVPFRTDDWPGATGPKP